MNQGEWIGWFAEERGEEEGECSGVVEWWPSSLRAVESSCEDPEQGSWSVRV